MGKQSSRSRSSSPKPKKIDVENVNLLVVLVGEEFNYSFLIKNDATPEEKSAILMWSASGKPPSKYISKNCSTVEEAEFHRSVYERFSLSNPKPKNAFEVFHNEHGDHDNVKAIPDSTLYVSVQDWN